MEVALPMTEAMTAIYGALGDLMASCVKELRGSNKIDAGEMRLEDGLFRAFDDIVRRQLDAVWHTVSPRTKQVHSVSAPLLLFLAAPLLNCDDHTPLSEEAPCKSSSFAHIQLGLSDLPVMSDIKVSSCI